MTSTPPVTLRPATREDCLSLWRWRNDPDTRRASFDGSEIGLEDHTRWYEGTLARSDRRIYIVQADGVDAGMVRLDRKGREATVSINLAPERRGQGVGVGALRAAASEVFGHLGLVRLVAKVKPDNIASRVVFERAGFSIARQNRDVVTFVRSSRLCIIPARGGSKRFPRKNVAVFDGMPLVVRAVKAAGDAGVFDRIIVSTEDQEITLLAKRAGAEIHHRPAGLSTDSARVVDVCSAVLDEWEAAEERFEAFSVLLPTSPFRTPRHVREALELFETRRANVVMSVTEFPHVPFWAVRDVRGFLRLQWGRDVLKSRDRLPPLYRHNGVVLWARTAAFRRYRDFYCPRVVPYYMSADDSVDIDHSRDLEFAEFLLQRRTS